MKNLNISLIMLHSEYENMPQNRQFKVYVHDIIFLLNERQEAIPPKKQRQRLAAGNQSGTRTSNEPVKVGGR